MTRGQTQLWLQTKEFEIVRHEQVVFVDISDGREDRLKGRLALAKNPQIHRHVAQGNFTLHRAPYDPSIGTVKAGGGNQPQTETGNGASARQRFVFLKKFIEQSHVARQQRLAEIE